MTKPEPVTVQLTPALTDRLGAVAAALDRPEAWVIERAVEDFLAVQDWQLAAIDDGMRAADAGRLVPQDDVVAWVRSWGSQDELPRSECA
jgi:predicted transcriptional regulator